MQEFLYTLNLFTILGIFNPRVSATSVLWIKFLDIILIENGIDVAEDANLQVANRFAVEVMLTIVADDGFVQKW